MDTLVYRALVDEVSQIKLARLRKEALPIGQMLGTGRRAVGKFFAGRAPTVATGGAQAARTMKVTSPAAGPTLAASPRGRMMPAKPTTPVQQLTPAQRQAQSWEKIFKSPAMQAERAAGEKWFQGRMAAQRAMPTPKRPTAQSWKKQTIRGGSPEQQAAVARLRAGFRQAA